MAPGDEQGENHSEHTVAQLHGRREADRETGTGPSELLRRGTKEECDRGDDKSGRERLGVEVEADVDVPLPVLPGRVAGQLATDQRPEREDAGGAEADRTAAGGVEADVGRRDGRDGQRCQRERQPDHERDGGSGIDPTARIGIIGSDQSSGHPNTAAPGGCIWWTGRVSATETAAVGSRIAIQRRSGDPRHRRTATTVAATTRSTASRSNGLLTRPIEEMNSRVAA